MLLHYTAFQIWSGMNMDFVVCSSSCTTVKNLLVPFFLWCIWFKNQTGFVLTELLVNEWFCFKNCFGFFGSNVSSFSLFYFHTLWVHVSFRLTPFYVIISAFDTFQRWHLDHVLAHPQRKVKRAAVDEVDNVSKSLMMTFVWKQIVCSQM